MVDNGRLTVDQKVKVVLFYAETNSVVATQRRFRAHFGARWAPSRQFTDFVLEKKRPRPASVGLRGFDKKSQQISQGGLLLS